jgi:hypothetical protein
MQMGIEEFTSIDIIRGLFALIFVIISLISGLKILGKYFKYKNISFISFGLTWIFISTPWSALPINLILVLLFNYAIEPLMYLYIMTAFIPLALICWIISFTILTYPAHKKQIILPYLIICMFYFIMYHVFLFINPDYISKYSGHYQYQHSYFIYIFLVFTLISALITGFLFALKSTKSEDPRIQWKGRLLFLAILLFVIGAIFDTLSFGNVIMQTIARFILIISAIEYYMGFFLPKNVEKWLIKEKKT